jgi:hypothetical protein
VRRDRVLAVPGTTLKRAAIASSAACWPWTSEEQAA